MSDSTNHRVRLVTTELVPDYVREADTVFNTSSQAATLLEDIAHADREHFVVLHLDVRSRVISRQTIAIGSLTMAVVHPREVFKGAILANAAAILVAHNHPSQDVGPSHEDIKITRRLENAGRILGIPVLDHLIMAADAYYSFADSDLITQPKGDTHATD